MATTESAAASTSDEGRIGLYLVKFVLGNEGMPGAPLLHVQALVDAPTGKISGHAQITQAVAPPNDEIQISNLTGQIRHLGFGPAKRVVALSGSYAQSVPPPAIGTFLVPVEANILIEEDAWVGHGSFSYGDRSVDNVPLHVED